jgi:hypothetical protein
VALFCIDRCIDAWSISNSSKEFAALCTLSAECFVLGLLEGDLFAVFSLPALGSKYEGSAWQAGEVGEHEGITSRL